MDKRSTYLIAGIIVVAVIVFAVISFQKTTIDTQSPDSSNAAEVASTSQWANTPAVPVVDPKMVITAKHAYRSGEHIVAGEVPLPTPCDILDANATVSTDKKSVLIQLVSSVKTGDKCPSDITPARFKVNAKADKAAKLSATFNSQPVTLNLIEAGPGEDLNNFELYIKG